MPSPFNFSKVAIESCETALNQMSEMSSQTKYIKANLSILCDIDGSSTEREFGRSAGEIRMHAGNSQY